MEIDELEVQWPGFLHLKPDTLSVEPETPEARVYLNTDSGKGGKMVKNEAKVK